jgi:hypothetical protein
MNVLRGAFRVIGRHPSALIGACCAVLLAGASWGITKSALPGALPQPAAVAQAELWESHVPYEHGEGKQADGRFLFVADYSASGAEVNTGPSQHYGRYTMPPVCDVTQSSCQLWPAFGAFDAFVTGDASKWQLTYGFLFCDGVCQVTNHGTVYKYDNRNTTGPLTTVPAGTDLTLEWSCQNQQTVTGEGECIQYDAFNNCIKHAPGSSGTNTYFTSTTGTGFTAGPIVGSAHVAPQTTTTYALSCKGNGTGFGDRVMHITIEVSDACPTVADAATDNPNGYSVASTDGKVKIPGLGAISQFCLINTGPAVFVPAKTEAELQSFINAIPNLAGLTKSNP